MSKNTRVSQRNYLHIRARLKPLDNKDDRVLALNNAIQEGLDSPSVEIFDFDEHLKKLKLEKRKNG